MANTRLFRNLACATERERERESICTAVFTSLIYANNEKSVMDGWIRNRWVSIVAKTTFVLVDPRNKEAFPRSFISSHLIRWKIEEPRRWEEIKRQVAGTTRIQKTKDPTSAGTNGSNSIFHFLFADVRDCASGNLDHFNIKFNNWWCKILYNFRYLCSIYLYNWQTQITYSGY